LTAARRDPIALAKPDAPAPHAENFSLVDVIGRKGTFDERFEAMTPLAREAASTGVVMREILSASAPRMSVRDTTGTATELVMLGSNNYLGLAQEPEIVAAAVDAINAFGVGCGGPPLLNGMTRLHRALERRLAEFKQCEAALIFSSGYAANVGWTTGMLAPGDFVVYDEQSHASLFDGIRMGRVRSVPVAHNDVGAFASALKRIRGSRRDANVVVCTEGVFSMDGDVAPLPELRALCDEHGALLAVDDAHGTGVLGAHGRGTPAHFGLDGSVDLVMGTFSKVFTTTGGFVAGSRRMIDYLRYCSRSYMFSASLAPSVVATVLAGIEFLERHPERVRRLHDNVAYLVDGLRRRGFDAESETGIIPLRLPPEAPVQAVVARLHEEGLFVNGVAYPAVGLDEQRLRLSVMATLTRDDLDFAIKTLARVGAELGVLRQAPGSVPA
jgi:glycine C-acetyltransferase